MNRPEIYHRSVDTLVRAYVNAELQPLCCRSCAVGNIIADVHGYTLKPLIIDGYIKKMYHWVNRHGKIIMTSWNNLRYDNNDPDAITEITPTGYTIDEIQRIEMAFMKGDCVYGDFFDNLMNVIDELDRIHEVMNCDVTAQSKEKFHKVIETT